MVCYVYDKWQVLIRYVGLIVIIDNMKAAMKEIEKLQSYFDELLLLFCRELDETETANQKVVQELRLLMSTPNMNYDMPQSICRQLKNKKTCGEILESLVSLGLIGYWNYKFLKKMIFFGTNQNMLEKRIKDYEKHYRHLIKEADFLTLMMIFREQPDLKPIHCIGLPKFLVKWKIEKTVKVSYWNKIVKKRFSWSDDVQLIDISLECIVLHFSVFPIAAHAIVRDLTDKQILMELKGKGIDITLSDELLFIGRLGKHIQCNILCA